MKISGLSELRTALRELNKNADKELAKAMLGIARGIALKIRGVMPRQSGHAVGTVQAHVRTRGASISIGTGNSDDYVPWLDFGGRVGRKNSISRPYIKEGRYLYPQIKVARPATLKALDEAIVKAAHAAGFETSGGPS